MRRVSISQGQSKSRFHQMITTIIVESLKFFTLLLGDHVASSTKVHKQKGHWFSLELQQKNPSFCKLVQLNLVPAHKLVFSEKEPTIRFIRKFNIEYKF